MSTNRCSPSVSPTGLRVDPVLSSIITSARDVASLTQNLDTSEKTPLNSQVIGPKRPNENIRAEVMALQSLIRFHSLFSHSDFMEDAQFTRITSH